MGAPKKCRRIENETRWQKVPRVRSVCQAANNFGISTLSAMNHAVGHTCHTGKPTEKMQCLHSYPLHFRGTMTTTHRGIAHMRNCASRVTIPCDCRRRSTNLHWQKANKKDAVGGMGHTKA